MGAARERGHVLVGLGRLTGAAGVCALARRHARNVREALELLALGHYSRAPSRPTSSKSDSLFIAASSAAALSAFEASSRLNLLGNLLLGLLGSDVGLVCSLLGLQHSDEG